MLFGDFEENLINLGLIAYMLLDLSSGWTEKSWKSRFWGILGNLWAVTLVFIPELFQEGGSGPLMTGAMTIGWLGVGLGIFRMMHPESIKTKDNHFKVFGLVVIIAFLSSLFGGTA